MDEWLSLTEEVVNPRARDDSDVIFDLLKDEATDNNDELIKVAQFFQVWQSPFFIDPFFPNDPFQALDSVGLRQTDPRLATMMKIFKQMKKDQGIASMHSLVMGREDFKA